MARGVARRFSGEGARARKDELAELNAKVRRFAPTVVTADASKLSPGDRRALQKIIEAARLFDPLFLRQVWSGNAALKRRLEADRSPLGRARLHYFNLNDGPWSQLDENKAFLEGVPEEKPPQAAHYPDDMTKEEFTRWVETLSEPERQKATGFFYAVRRGPDRKLKLVPYSELYREYLVPSATLLREAARLTANATLKDYLSKRAAAFLSDDYYESDLAWMALYAPIDLTSARTRLTRTGSSATGAFEAYVTLRDEAETQKLARFSNYLQELEDICPSSRANRSPKLGASSPIRVVNVVFSSGEGNSASRPPPSTSPTTSASSPRRARSASCSRTFRRRISTRLCSPSRASCSTLRRARTSPSKPFSRTSSRTSCCTASGRRPSRSAGRRRASASSSKTPTAPSRRPRPTSPASGPCSI